MPTLCPIQLLVVPTLALGDSNNGRAGVLCRLIRVIVVHVSIIAAFCDSGP
jgi:hypothetical protein